MPIFGELIHKMANLSGLWTIWSIGLETNCWIYAGYT